MEDRTFTVEVNVTAADIKAGRRQANNDPLSKALKRMGYKRVVVSLWFVVVDGVNLQGGFDWDEFLNGWFAGDRLEPQQFSLRGCNCGDCVLCRFTPGP